MALHARKVISFALHAKQLEGLYLTVLVPNAPSVASPLDKQ